MNGDEYRQILIINEGLKHDIFRENLAKKHHSENFSDFQEKFPFIS